MKYLKKFNEKLKSSTYISAANKLSALGHVNRSGELYKFADTVLSKENLDKFSRSGIYSIDFYQKKAGNSMDDVFLFTGNFYVTLNFYDDMFLDVLADWVRSENRHNLWLSLDMGFVPADEETRQKIRDTPGFLNISHGKEMRIWTQWITIKIYDGEMGNINPSDYNNISLEMMEWDLGLFSSRQEAFRFKKYLVSYFEDVLSGDINTSISNSSDDIKEVIPSDFTDKLLEVIKKFSINALYREK